MAAILVHTSDMLGNVRCNGVKVLVEHCSQKELRRQSEKHHAFFMSDNGLT